MTGGSCGLAEEAEKEEEEEVVERSG